MTSLPRQSQWQLRSLLAVGVGGSLGTLARYELGQAVPTAANAFPWTTLAINVSGAFVLALLLLRLAPSTLRLGLTTGVLGGFTTMSAFATDTALLIDHGHILTALGYAAASAALGLGAGAAAFAMSRRTTP